MDDLARALLDVTDEILGELDPDAVIVRVLEAGRRLTGARYAAIGVLDESGETLARFLTSGIDERVRAEIGPLPRGRGVLGELIRNPVPLRLNELGDHPRSYGFPIGHPPMSSFLGVPVFVDGVPYASLYLTAKDGGPFTDADEDSVVTLARSAGLALSHARGYASAATQRDELIRTVTALKATTEIARAIGAESDVGAILELVAKRGRALVAARALLIETVDGGELVVSAVAGDAPRGLTGQRIGLAGTVASTALRTGLTQRLEGTLNRARFDQHGLGRLGVSADAGLVVPLIFHGRRYGVLIALDHLHEDRVFTVDDLRLLEAFAASAATALASVRATESELHRQRLAAAEDERRRWARELHDETLQSLGALRILLAGAQRRGGLPALVRVVADATEHLDQAIGNLRSLVTDLRPPAFDALGLQAALDALTERASSDGLEIDSSMDLAYEQGREPGRLIAELEMALYRISQEALTNAIKHGHATRAGIEIIEHDATVRLSVCDNGSGFDPTVSTTGVGLLGMRERVQLLGGTLDLASAPGNGTTIVARFPAARVRADQPPEVNRSVRAS